MLRDQHHFLSAVLTHFTTLAKFVGHHADEIEEPFEEAPMHAESGIGGSLQRFWSLVDRSPSPLKTNEHRFYEAPGGQPARQRNQQ